jgi:spore coat protein U-like protein
MKKLAAVVMAALMVAMAGVAMAADSTSVTVTATVLGTCQFNSTPSLDFGTLDPTSGDNAEIDGNLTFCCTKNADYTLGDDKSGSGGNLSSTLVKGGDSIAAPISCITTCSRTLR